MPDLNLKTGPESMGQWLCRLDSKQMPAEVSSNAAYIADVRKVVLKAMCLQHFSSEIVERHSKPEIEIRSCDHAVFSAESLLKSEKEGVLVERSVNSVRISVRVKKMDDLDTLLCHKFARFLMQRAENFIILRKKPIKDYDVSFLVTDKHLSSFVKEKVTDFITTFLQEVDKEISEMKIGINARARGVSAAFLKSIS